MHQAKSNCFGCKGSDVESRRPISDVASSITVLIAYCNVFLNPLIYMLRYDVVKLSLIDWVKRKLRKQPPPTTT